ncbi:unnamed protein product [Closterium sp. Naga37s-1]|nr:unnamed protein product [Closterium sp. Naga37s-1]
MATLSLARCPADIAGASIVSADVSADLRLLAAHLPCGDVAVCALGSPVRPAAATTHVLFRDRADPADADAPPHAPSYHRRLAWLCPRQQPGEPCDQGQSHDRILVLLRPSRVSLYAIRAGTSPLSGNPIPAASVQARRVSDGRAGVRVVFWPGDAHESSSARGANDALHLASGAADGAGEAGRWEQLAGGGEAAAHMSMGAGSRMGFSMSAWHAHFDSAPWHSLLAACGVMAAGEGGREQAHSSGEASMQGSGSEGGAWGCAVEQVVAVGVEADPHASHLALLLTSRQAYSHMCLSPSALRCQAPLPAHSSVLVLAVAGGASTDNGRQGTQGDAGGMVEEQWRGVQGEQGRGAGAVVRVQCCIHLHAVTGAQHGAGAMWSAVKLQGAVLCAVQPWGAAFTWSAASGRPLHSLLLTPAGPTPLAPTHASAPPHALHLHGADASASSRSSESSHSYPPMDDTHCSLGVAAGGMGDVVGVVLGWQGALLCAVTTTGLVLTALLRAPPPLPAPLAPAMRSVLLCSPLASGRLLLGLVHADRPGPGEGSTAVLTLAVLHSPHTPHHSLPDAAPHPAADATCPAPKARVAVYSFPLTVPHNHAPTTHTPLAPALPSLSLPSPALPLLSCHRLLCLSNDRLLLLLPARLPSPLHLSSSAPLFPMCHLPRSCLPSPPPAAALRMSPTLAALQLEGVPSPAPCGGGEQQEGGERVQRGGHFASVVVGGSGVVERWVGAERQEEAWVCSVSEAMGAVMAIEGDVMNREDLGGTAFLALLHHTAHANGTNPALLTSPVPAEQQVALSARQRWPDSCLVLQHVRLCLDLMCPAPSVVRLLFLLHGISAPLQVKAFHCLLSYLIAHLPLARFSRSHARYTSSLLAHAIRALLQALLLHYHTAPASPHRARRPHSSLRPRTPAGAGRHGGVVKGEKGRGGGKRRQGEGEAGSEEQAVQRASMEALSDVLLTLRRLHTAATRLAAHHAAPSAATAAPTSTAGGAAESSGSAGGVGGGAETQSGMLLLCAPHAEAALPSGPMYARLPPPHHPPSFLMPHPLPDHLSVPSSLLTSQPPHQPTTLATSPAQPLALPPPPSAAPPMDILPHQLPVLPPYSAPMRAWMEGGEQESVRAMLQRWQQQQSPSQVVVCDAIAACRLPLATAFLHHRLLHPPRTRTQQPLIQGTGGEQHKAVEEEEDDTDAGEEGGAEAESDGREAGREEAGRAGREEAEHVVQVEGRRLALAFLWQGHAGMAAQVLLRLGAHVHASLLDLLLRSFSSHLRHVLSHYLHLHHLLPPPLLHSLAATQAIQDMYPLRSFTSAYRLRRACAPASLQPRLATCAAPNAPPGTVPDSAPEGGRAAADSGGGGEACEAGGQGVTDAGGESVVDERGVDGGAGLVALVPAQGGQRGRQGVEAWGEGAGGGEKEKMEAEGVGEEEQSRVKAGDDLSVVVRHGFACVATAWVQHWDSALLLQVLAEGAFLASSPTPSVSSSCSPTFSSSGASSALTALHHILATHRLHIPPSLPASPPPSPASLVAREAVISLSLRHHLPALLSSTLHALPPTSLARSPITAALHRPPHYSLTTSTAPTRPCMCVPVVLAAAVLEPTTALLRAEVDGVGGSADGRGSSGFMRRALEEQLAAQGVLLTAHWRHPLPLLRLLARAHMLLPPKGHAGGIAGGGVEEAGGVDGVGAGRRGDVGEGEGDEGKEGDGEEVGVLGGEGGGVGGLQWSAVGMTLTCSALRLPLLLHLFLDTHSASHYTRMQQDTLEDDMRGSSPTPLAALPGPGWVKGARQERVGGADVDAWGDDDLWWWQEEQWGADEWCARGSRVGNSGDEASGDREMGDEEEEEDERGEGEAEEQGEEGKEEEMADGCGSGGGSGRADAHGRSAGATQVHGRRAGSEVRRAAGGWWEEVPVSAVEQWQQHLWRSLLLALLLHPPSHPAVPSHLPLFACLDRLLGQGRMAAQGDRGRGRGEGRGKDEEEGRGEWWRSGMGRREEVVAVLGGGRGMWQMRGVRMALTASQHPAQGITLPCLVPPALLSPPDSLHHHLHAISHHATPLPPTPALALALRLHLLLFTPVSPNPLASHSLPPATFPWELPPSFPLPCALQLAPHAALQRLPSLSALSHSLASPSARPHAPAWLNDISPMATRTAPQAPTSAHPSALLPLPHSLRHQLLAASPLALFLSLLPSLLSPSVARASLKATTHHLHGLASAAALLARTHTPLLASASTFLSLLGLSSSRLRLVIAALHLILSSSPPPSPSSLAAVTRFLHCYCSAWAGGQQGGAGRAGEAAQHKAARQLLRLLEGAVLGEAEGEVGKGEGGNGAGGICVVEVGAVEKGGVGKGVVQGWSNHAVEMVGEEEQQERQRRVQQAMQRREQQQQQRDEWALVLALAAEFSLPPPNTLLLRFARANDWVWLGLHRGLHVCVLCSAAVTSRCSQYLHPLSPAYPPSPPQMGLLAQAQAQTWPLHDLLHIVMLSNPLAPAPAHCTLYHMCTAFTNLGPLPVLTNVSSPLTPLPYPSRLLAASTHTGSHGLAAAAVVVSAQGEVEILGWLGDGGEEEGEAEEGVEEECGGGLRGNQEWVLGLQHGKRRRVEAERGWKGERQAAAMAEGEQRVPHSQAQPGAEATQVEGQGRRHGGEEARGMGLGGMVAWLCREGCVLPLLRGLHLFLPRCSLLYLLLALQAHWRQHSEEAEACVAEFNVLADREHAHAQAAHHHQGHALGEVLGDLEGVWGAEGAVEEEQAATHDLPPLHTRSSFFSPSFSLRSLALRCALSPSAILSSLASLAVDAAIARAASPHQTLSLLHLLSRARLPPPAQRRLQQLQVEAQLLSGDPSGPAASPLPSMSPVAAHGNTSSAAGARLDGGAEQSWAEGGRGWVAATEQGEGGVAERAESGEAGWGNEALQQLVQAGRWNEARVLAGRLEGHGGSTARGGGARMADGGGDSHGGGGWMGERVEQAGGGDEEGDELGEGSTGAASMTQEASALQARITLTQAEHMVQEWQQLLWEEEEERAVVWEHCHHLFMRHRLPPHRAVAFFLAHACSLGTQLSRPTATPAAVPASDSDAEGRGGSRKDGVGAVEGKGEDEEERVEAETDPLSEGLWSAVSVWGEEEEGQEEDEEEEVWSEAGEEGGGWGDEMECAQRRARCLHPVLLLALQWNLRASAAAPHTAPEECTTPHATTTECELSLAALACRVWEVAALADHPLPSPLHCTPFPGLAVPLCSLWHRLARGPVTSFLARTARVMAANQDALCAAAAAPLDSPPSPSSCTAQLPLPPVWPSAEGGAGRGEEEERAREGVVQVLLERGQMEGARAVSAHVGGGGGRDGMMEADVAMVEAAEAIAVHEGMMDEDMHAMVLHACRTCPVEDDTRHLLFSDQPLDVRCPTQPVHPMRPMHPLQPMLPVTVLTALARLASLPSARLCILRCFARRHAMQLLTRLSEPLCNVTLPALLRALLAEGEAAVASVQLLLATGVLSGADAVPAVAERIVQVIDSGYSSAASTTWRSAAYRRFTDVRGRGHGDGEGVQGVGAGSTAARGAARQGSANVAHAAFMSPLHTAVPPPPSSAASPRSFHPSPLLARASSLSSSSSSAAAAASGRGLGHTASGKALWGGDAPSGLDAASRLPWDESEVAALLSLLSHHPSLHDLPFALPPLPPAAPPAPSSSRGESSEAPPLIFLPLALLHCLKHLDGANANTQVDVLLLAHYASVAVPLAANETLPRVTEAMVQCAVSLAAPSLASASLRLLLASTNPRPLCFILTRLLASGQLAFLLSRLPAAASAAHAVRSVFLQATLPAASASNPMSTMLSLSAFTPPPSTATTTCATCARGCCPVPTAVPHASRRGSGVGGGRCSGGGGCLALEVRIALHTAGWSQGLCDDSKNLVLQQLGPARELAEAHERRAGDYLADWRALQSSRWLHANDDAAVLMLLDAMRCLCAAASMWDGLGAGDRARRSVAQAALLGLQVHVGDTLVGLTPAAASVLLQQQHRFFEALVIANAYDLTSPADWSLLLWTHLDRFRPSPEFLDEWAMAVPMALDMLLDVAERVQHEVGNNRSAHVNYLAGAFRHLLWLVPNLEERLQLATVSRAAPAEVDKCLSMLDRVPATSAPLLLRRGHGGAYMPVL